MFKKQEGDNIGKVVDLDNTPLTIGKYKGKTPSQISDEDPEYISWLYENIKPHLCSRALYLACQSDYWRNDDVLKETYSDD